MRIDIPCIDQQEMLDDCIDNINDSGRKRRLKDCEEDIILISKKYKKMALTGDLCSEEPPDNPFGKINKEDMIYLYDERLVKSKMGRLYYDKIMANAPQGICPICGYHVVNTLDHYMPKSLFFQYAVSVENLVPTCITCNKNKTNKIPEDRAHELIHPYYDDFDDETWLFADIVEDAGEPFGFSFRASKPTSWDMTKFNRVENHIRVFKLKTLFCLLSAAEINSVLQEYARLYHQIGDIGFVKDHVKDLSDIKRNENRNSWKAAMYQSIYESEWMWEEFFPKYVGR